MSYKNSTTNFTKGPQPPRFIMNGHKKTRASCLLFILRHLEIRPRHNNRTIARAYTI